MKRKIYNFVILIFMMMFLSSCAVKTPEELIEPPEVDSEKKQILNLVSSFMPANSEILNLGSSITDSTSSLVNTNLDDDFYNDEEIVVLYRNKNTREIGIFILSHDGIIWDKKFEKNLASTDIADYFVVDLNNDGKYEIVVGYFEDISKRLIIIANNDNEYKVVYSQKYLALNISENMGSHLIAISTPFDTQANNKLSVMKYDGKNIYESANKLYDYDVEIYKIEYGNINVNTKAYVIDNYKDVYLGSTDILELDNKRLTSVVNNRDKEKFSQEVLDTSSDINNDGIIEISGNEILTNGENNQSVVLNKYYNIDENREVKLLKSMYEDYSANIKIDIKEFPSEKLFVLKSDYKDLKIYYVDSNKKEWKLLELINEDLNSNYYNSSEYEIILEKNKEAIIAKYENHNELQGDDKKFFDEIYDILRKNEESIKFIE